MHRQRTFAPAARSLLSIPFGVLVAIAPIVAHAAAPRVGLIIASHQNLPADQADEIAGEVATAVAGRIEGEALSGPSVRDLLPPGAPEPGCHERPDCARSLARAMKTDEALFLELRKINKVIVVTLHRVARDPDRIPTEGQLRLAGPRGKRGKAISDAVDSLYPPGSVIPFKEQAEPPPPIVTTVLDGSEDDIEPIVKKKKSKASPGDDKPVWKKPWFFPVVIGGAAIVITGVAVGIGYGIEPSPSAPTIQLP